MIKYDLLCTNGHEFDSWFRDSAAYDHQAVTGLVSCPHCGTSEVQKQLMRPRIPTKSNRHDETSQIGQVEQLPVAHQTTRQTMASGPVDPRQQQAVKMLRELRKQVEQNADYVGDKFAEEARRIHFDEVPERAIFGETTIKEAKSLIEDGIEIHPLPQLPEENN